MHPAEQLRLKLRLRTSDGGEAVIVSSSNAAAVGALESWPAWPDGCLALVGPEGSGKSLLSRAWAARSGARIFAAAGSDVSGLRGAAVLFEDADRGPADETLFHLINMVGPGSSLLLTARTAPQTWVTALPDLRSRLNALVVARIEEPDDALLEGVLRKFFRERSIKPSDDLYPFLIRRIERSIRAAKDVVSRLDDLAEAGQRDITRALARQIFEQEDTTLDLFE
ncbi:MAG TPA: DnaA/Hda family protein [Caulobacteraceae bacterium]